MAGNGNGFDILFRKNVPHILEKIFLSLDYQSFKTSQEVSEAWNQVLTSESLKAKAKSVFYGEISKELLNACSGCDLDHDCEGYDCESKDGNADDVTRLLSTGLVDLNCENKNEETPLHVAAKYGHNVVRALLDAGANINKDDFFGRTPLYVAVEYNAKDVVHMLLSRGADINIQGGFYKATPLHVAAGYWYGDPEMVQLLLNRGADINPTNGIGMTPYDIASETYDGENYEDTVSTRTFFDEDDHKERKDRHSKVLDLLEKNGGLSRTDLP